jgi:hypothetical protein
LPFALRFARSKHYVEALSKWIRASITPQSTYSSCMESLAKFCQQNVAALPVQQQIVPVSDFDDEEGKDDEEFQVRRNRSRTKSR